MGRRPTIRVLIVDDHPMVREGIKFMLEPRQHQICFKVAEAASGEEAIKKVSSGSYDVVIVDYQMPEENGDTVIAKMLHRKPGLKILAVSNYGQLVYIKKMMAAGAKGYILKNIEPAELAGAIKSVMEGGIYYSNEIALKMLGNTERKLSLKTKNKYGLTDREIQVLKLIAEEKTNDEIAGLLFVSKRTIDTHRQRILKKIQAKNTAGLIKAAYDLNLIEEE